MSPIPHTNISAIQYTNRPGEGGSNKHGPAALIPEQGDSLDSTRIPLLPAYFMPTLCLLYDLLYDLFLLTIHASTSANVLPTSANTLPTRPSPVALIPLIPSLRASERVRLFRGPPRSLSTSLRQVKPATSNHQPSQHH